MARVTALSTLTYTDQSFETAAAQIAARGFRRVDIAHLGYYCLHFPLGEAHYARIADVLRQNYLEPVALNHYGGTETWSHVLNRADEVTTFRQMMTAVLCQAQRLGIPKVMASMGRRTTDADALDRIHGAAQVISEVADEAHSMGIQITVEVPHTYSLAFNLEGVAAFFDHATSPNVVACVDCSHWGLLGYDFDELMVILKGRLAHVHLRDSAGSDDGSCCQNLELTPGKGEVDMALFASYLDKYDYLGEVTLETEFRGMSVECIERELDYALKHLHQSGWELPDEVKEKLQ